MFSNKRSASLKGLTPKSTARKQKNRYKHKLKRASSTDDKHLVNLPSGVKYDIIKSSKMMVQVARESNTPKLAAFFPLSNEAKHWEFIQVELKAEEIEFATEDDNSPLFKPLPYNAILKIGGLAPSKGKGYRIKITTASFNVMLQLSDAYQRDRWLHTIQWMKNVNKHRAQITQETSPKIVLEAVKNLISLTIQSPINLSDARTELFGIVSDLLLKNATNTIEAISDEEILRALAPLSLNNHRSEEICEFFIQHCEVSPRSNMIREMFTPMVKDILKYTTDFGKRVQLRTFVKCYIESLAMQNNGKEAVNEFIDSLHGPISTCPHLRIVSNLVSVCLSAIYYSFVKDSKCKEKNKSDNSFHDEDNIKKETTVDKIDKRINLNNNTIVNNAINPQKRTNFDKNEINEMENKKYTPTYAVDLSEPSLRRYSISYDKFNSYGQGGNLLEQYKPKELKMDEEIYTLPEESVETALLFADVLLKISTYHDWLPSLASLLQPVPFAREVLKCKRFMYRMTTYVETVMDDGRDELLWKLVSTRSGKKGWVQLFGIYGSNVQQDGNIFSRIVSRLLQAAVKSGERKVLVTKLYHTQIDDVQLLALREDESMIKILCLILEYNLQSSKQMETQIVTTLKSTIRGGDALRELCEKQDATKTIDADGGPVSYCFPPRSTDQDLENFARSSSHSNLKSLNLSLTSITCASAKRIAQFSSLQQLNLWSCNIQDKGLVTLCEKLNLVSLNLCETGVTDKSIRCLRDMTNLRYLNLNSTKLSRGLFTDLVAALPNLSTIDVTYSPADCV